MNRVFRPSCDKKDIKKEPFLNGSLNSTGTKALRADVKLSRFSAAYIDSDALNVDIPAASGMAVRVADVVSRYRAAAAAITELGHSYSLLASRKTINQCIVS
jgi:hypothetical protein